MLTEVATDIEISILNHGESVLPDTLVSKVFSTIFNCKFDLMEVGVKHLIVVVICVSNNLSWYCNGYVCLMV